MKNLLYNIRQALHELVHGRNMPELSQIQVPQKVITVDIQTHKVVPQSAPIKVVSPSPVQSISDAVEITKRSVESQSGETPVVLPYEDDIILNHLTKTHRGLVFKYIIKRLNKAIRNNWPTVAVFRFGTTTRVAQIGRPVYETQLNGMMKWFVETEDYESAGTCRDLIRQLNSTNVVD